MLAINKIHFKKEIKFLKMFFIITPKNTKYLRDEFDKRPANLEC